MTQENWWILEQEGYSRIREFLAEAERDNLAREAGLSGSPLRGAVASLLRTLAARLDDGGRATSEPTLAPAR